MTVPKMQAGVPGQVTVHTVQVGVRGQVDVRLIQARARRASGFWSAQSSKRPTQLCAPVTVGCSGKHGDKSSCVSVLFQTATLHWASCPVPWQRLLQAIMSTEQLPHMPQPRPAPSLDISGHCRAKVSSIFSE